MLLHITWCFSLKQLHGPALRTCRISHLLSGVSKAKVLLISFNRLLNPQVQTSSQELSLAVQWLISFHSWHDILNCLNWGTREIVIVTNLQILRPLTSTPCGCLEHPGNSCNRRLDNTNGKKPCIFILKIRHQGKLKLSWKFSNQFGFEYKIVWRLIHFLLCKLILHLPIFSLCKVTAMETKIQLTVSSSPGCALLSKRTGRKCCGFVFFFLN